MDEAAGAVLDASALLAYLRGEPGAETVREALVLGAVINVVSYAEVLSRLSDAGEDPETTHRNLQQRGIIGGLLTVVPLEPHEAVAIAGLRSMTRAHCLSLGDRICLATARHFGWPALTADRSWAAVDAGVPIRLIRS
jgi:PIN domain nuclease of toxin-antitoxin system